MFDNKAINDRFYNETMQHMLATAYNHNISEMMRDYLSYFQRKERYEDCAMLLEAMVENNVETDLNGYEPKTQDMESLYDVCYEYTLLKQFDDASVKFANGEIGEDEMQSLRADIIEYFTQLDSHLPPKGWESGSSSDIDDLPF